MIRVSAIRLRRQVIHHRMGYSIRKENYRFRWSCLANSNTFLQPTLHFSAAPLCSCQAINRFNYYCTNVIYIYILSLSLSLFLFVFRYIQKKLMIINWSFGLLHWNWPVREEKFSMMDEIIYKVARLQITSMICPSTTMILCISILAIFVARIFRQDER